MSLVSMAQPLSSGAQHLHAASHRHVQTRSFPWSALMALYTDCMNLGRAHHTQEVLELHTSHTSLRQH